MPALRKGEIQSVTLEQVCSLIIKSAHTHLKIIMIDGSLTFTGGASLDSMRKTDVRWECKKTPHMTMFLLGPREM